MIGAGVFINTIILSQFAGGLGALTYFIVALLLLPLIFVFSKLLFRVPGGSLYEFGSLLSPTAGFLSIWGYYAAKLAGAAVGIHTCVLLLQEILPPLQGTSPLIYDCIIIGIFTFLNTRNVSFGSAMQMFFILMKAIPLLAVIIPSIFTIAHGVDLEPYLWDGMISCLPFVLFVFSGFEACCAISAQLPNPAKNAPLVLLSSYATALTIIMLYQAGFYLLGGETLLTLSSFIQGIPIALSYACKYTWLYAVVFVGSILGIAMSALGASYSIIYSNIWNVHRIATLNLLPQSALIKRANAHGAPLVAVFITSLICASYLIITGGAQALLQQISALGATTAYCITSLAFLWQRNNVHDLLLGILSLTSCAILLSGIIKNSVVFGPLPLATFITVCIIGIILKEISGKSA